MTALIDELSRRGYSADAEVLEAWKYGVPQHRSRLFVVGILGATGLSWPTPRGRRPTLRQAIGDLPVVPPDQREEVLDYEGPPTTRLARSLRDEVARVRSEREQVQEKLRRLGKAFVDGMVDEPDYERHKAQLEFDLTALVVPEADAVAEAGRLVQCLPELWTTADLAERRRLLLTVLDAVYVDAREARAVVSIRPKAAFEAVLMASTLAPGGLDAGTASSRDGSSVCAGGPYGGTVRNR